MPRCRACVQGVGGAVQYPKNYLKEAFELVRERGGLCIADEVLSRFNSIFLDFLAFPILKINSLNFYQCACAAIPAARLHTN